MQWADVRLEHMRCAASACASAKAPPLRARAAGAYGGAAQGGVRALRRPHRARARRPQARPGHRRRHHAGGDHVHRGGRAAGRLRLGARPHHGHGLDQRGGPDAAGAERRGACPRPPPGPAGPARGADAGGAQVHLYTMHGQAQARGFSLGAEVAAQGVADAVLYGGGLVALTAGLQLWAVADLEEPRPQRLADPRLAGPPHCLAVIEPRHTLSGCIEARAPPRRPLLLDRRGRRRAAARARRCWSRPATACWSWTRTRRMTRRSRSGPSAPWPSRRAASSWRPLRPTAAWSCSPPTLPRT